jgi:hypothetical protein
MTYKRFKLPEISGSAANAATAAAVHADTNFRADSRAHESIPTVKTKLVSYNQAISTRVESHVETGQKFKCARAPAAVAAVAALAPARAALAKFKQYAPYGKRFLHDQACWGAEMFLRQWGDVAAELEWPLDDIFGRNGLAWWLGVEIVTALGPEHAVTETNRVYDRITHKDWVNDYGVQGNG